MLLKKPQTLTLVLHKCGTTDLSRGTPDYNEIAEQNISCNKRVSGFPQYIIFYIPRHTAEISWQRVIPNTETANQFLPHYNLKRK